MPPKAAAGNKSLLIDGSGYQVTDAERVEATAL
jgi:hypothetical protein